MRFIDLSSLHTPTAFEDFSIEMADIEVLKSEKFDRMWQTSKLVKG